MYKIISQKLVDAWRDAFLRVSAKETPTSKNDPEDTSKTQKIVENSTYSEDELNEIRLARIATRIRNQKRIMSRNNCIFPFPR
jgi:hypothetical protein